ncbi:MAG: O-acetyl-ADP-ribose deacetylase [Spirochaetaceae bacterium]
MTELLNGRLVVTTGDITRLEVDGVVNAANSSLMGGGGVDGAIHRAGGPAILDECKRIRKHDYPDGLPTGAAVVTTGGDLPAEFVIHTVGPVWHGGADNEDEQLEAAYRNSLDAAGFKAMKSVAFPAISTGVYGFPKDRAARIAYRAVAEYARRNTVPRTIYFVFFTQEDADTFLEAIRDKQEAG